MLNSKIALVLAASALVLSACDNGPSAVAQKPAASDDAAGGTAIATNPNSEVADAAREDHRDDPVAKIDGKPMWSASRRYSADENAQRAFARNGDAFGADTVDAFVEKAHDFVHSPPRGTLTLTRANGDVLLYDPKGNVFAVKSRAGAPRTMFKPDDGMAYWEEQKAREARRQANRRNTRDDDDA